MFKLAVIGKDVSKSDSAKMHTFDFQGLGSECSYELISAPQEEFDAAAKRLLAEYDAFNVTIPYKLDIIPYLKEIGETAMRRMEQLEADLLRANPAPDKATQQLAWVQHMNMLRAQAEEIVMSELIYT